MRPCVRPRDAAVVAAGSYGKLSRQALAAPAIWVPVAWMSAMAAIAACYKRHRFPPVVIAHVVWLYLCFLLSLRAMEKLLT